jgi:NADPH:quinone reductase-like Zn-dependent oxidoreductase
MTMSRTMRAVRVHRFGGPEVLAYEGAPRPKPHGREVLVRVHAAGVNRIDSCVREGVFEPALPAVFPFIPGCDFSGTVERAPLGRSVSVARGDAVFGRTYVWRGGSYAEYLAVTEDELALKPRSVDHARAAAVPFPGLAAWQALFEPANANVLPGQTVMVHGPTSDVGTFVVQLAKWRGARVIAPATAAEEPFVRELGVDAVVEPTLQRFADVVRDIDAVVDTVGGTAQSRSWEALRRGGAMVSTIATPFFDEAATARGIRASMVYVRTLWTELAQLARLIDQGVVRVFVSSVLPLAEASRAHALAGSFVTSLLVRPNEEPATRVLAEEPARAAS